MYEYDLSKQNLIKIDWFEFSQLGFILDDQFGKMSRNLVKKEIHLDKNGNLYKQTDFQFMVDAEGYPAAMDLINSNYTLKYTFKFQ